MPRIIDLKSRFGIFISLLIGTVVLIGCSSEGTKSGHLPSTVVVLFDISQKEKTPIYLEDYHRIVENMGGGDTLVVKVISENLVEDPQGEKVFRFPVYDANRTTELRYKKDLQEIKVKASDEAIAFVEGVQTIPTSRKLIHSTYAASNLFQEYGAENSVLVIFSNMIEKSAYKEERTGKDVFYDFCRDGWRLNATIDTDLCGTCTYPEAIIKEEISKGRVKRLDGVTVYAVGGASCNSKDIREYNSIKRFWIQYFISLGADLDEAKYKARLTEFQLK